MNKQRRTIMYTIIMFTHAAKYVHHCGLRTKHTFAAIQKSHESNRSKYMSLLNDFPGCVLQFLSFYF